MRHTMSLRSIRSVLAVPLVVTLAGTVASLRTAHAQTGFADDPGVRGPRFYLAHPSARSARVPLDVARVPSLRQRIALDLDGVTVKDALREISELAGLPLVYTEQLLPAGKRVHLRADAITVVAALTDVLIDAGVDVVFRPNGSAALVRRERAAAPAQAGTVTGRVTDQTTGEPVVAAQVTVVGMRLSRVTDDAGQYTLPGVPAGAGGVRAMRLGYEPQTQTVTVPEGGTVPLDFALARSVSTLDEVIVAGTIVESSKRQSPVPVTVISEEQIQTPSRNRIEQLFRGDVPGVVGYDLGSNSLGSYAFVRGRATFDLYNLLKVYVDGIEMPSIDLISAIDLRNIERIELLRGPQASTVYGSNASGGVLLLFTKNGAIGGPRIRGSTAVGFTNSAFVSSTPMSTENRLALSGGGQGFNYSVGGSYEANGAITPEADLRQYGFNARTQITQGRLGLGFTGALSRRVYGVGILPANNAFFAELRQILGPRASQFGIPAPGTRQYTNAIVGNQMVGANFSLAPTSWWQHNLTVGWDRLYYDQDQYRPRLSTPADTLRQEYVESHENLSARYNTSANVTLSPSATLTLTLGTDQSRRSTTSTVSNAVGSLAGTAAASFTAPRISTNQGYYAQSVLGLGGRLFLTGAVRLERFDTGADLEDNSIVAPRAGLAYSFDFPNVVVKPRLSYGKAVRPPTAAQIAGTTGTRSRQLANPNLRPEVSTGFDGGFDLDIHRGALGIEVTYFDQRARDLIGIASSIDANFVQLFQYLNLGTIRNKGVELAASTVLGPVTLRGQFTKLRSRVLAISTPSNQTLDLDLAVGDRPTYTAEESGGLTGIVSFAPLFARRSGARASFEAGLTYIGDRVTANTIAFNLCRFGAGFGQAARYCGSVDPRTATQRDFLDVLPALTKVRVALSHPIGRDVEGFANVDNLFNSQRSELLPVYPARGRAVLFGVRFGR